MTTEKTTNHHTFSVSVVGENTGELYVGDFTMIRFLSSRQHFLQDQFYKQYLGGDPQFSSGFAKERAEILSEVNAYCVKFPEFWTKDGSGVDIVDNNVLLEVYKEMNKAYKEIADARKEKVEAAAKRLREVADKAEKTSTGAE